MKVTNQTFNRRVRAALMFATCAGLSAACLAASFTWDGGGGDNNWQSAANWNPDGTPPADGSAALVFQGSVRTAPSNNYPQDTAFNGLSFPNAAAPAFTLSGNRIILAGGVNTTQISADGITVTDVIGLPILLGANATFSLGARHTLTVNGVIGETGGARALTKANSSGELTHNGANTFSGAVTLNG
ncbi:MAG: hypothetical protein LBW77_00795, partial [Verrucomicrobiota bacterium]|nr:hypothetical protein [Verrucomicrobiota bacterium]